MTHLTTNLVLSLAQISENSGRLCYHNIVDTNSITATSEATGKPATNMANPSTAFGWEALDTSDQTITIINQSSEPIDYIGIARHNLSQSGVELRIRFDGATVRNYVPISDVQAQLFLFEEATPGTIQIDIRGASEPVKMSVIYVGMSLQLQRNIYVGHTPINYGRDRAVINGVSQSGEYLGQVVTNETLSTSVSLQNLTPDWYRESLDPFFASLPRPPCFWAWRPVSYPTEVGYCWVEGNPRPTNQRSNGMMQISWNFRGIA